MTEGGYYIILFNNIPIIMAEGGKFIGLIFSVK